MKMIDEGIINGFLTLIKLCGYIVLFSIFTKIILEMFQNSPLILKILLGNIEISNGIALLKNITMTEKIKYIVTIQFLSFGGLSGIAQTISLLEAAGLSSYKYIIGKVILSLLLTLFTIMYVSNFILQL